ncbi:MAG: hypothetical protein CV087_09370 [Candidatus Brocadia sp. WS118]|nr:MAG: hypothetical protein CV087_09370 [Candidatus Brocadia sp. WS118]
MAASDAKPYPKKNEAFRVTFPIFDDDGDLVSGAAGLDSEISKDGGTFTDCTNEATEIATSSGMYFLDLTATEMNADTVTIIVKTSTSGAKTTPIVLYPVEDGDIPVDVRQWMGSAPNSLQSGRMDSYIGAKDSAVGLSTQEKADANAEMDTALADYDGPTKAELDAAQTAIQNDIAALDFDAVAIDTYVYWDNVNGDDANEGLPGAPVQTWSRVNALLGSRNLRKVFCITSGTDYVIGDHLTGIEIRAGSIYQRVNLGNRTYIKCEFFNLTPVGAWGSSSENNNVFHHCNIDGSQYYHRATYVECLLSGTIKIDHNFSLGDKITFIDCRQSAYDAGYVVLESTYYNNVQIEIYDFIGKLKIGKIANGSVDCLVDIRGELILESTVTGGNWNISGTGKFTDNSSGTTVDTSAFIDVEGGMVSKSLAAQAQTDVENAATNALNAYDPPTKAELDTAESNIRGADSDTLKTLSDQIDDVSTFDPATDTVDVGKLGGDAALLTRLKESVGTIIKGTAQSGTLTTSEMTTNLTEATNDHYNDRIIIWITGTLTGQAAQITDYDGTAKKLTFTPVTEAPIANDEFIIV